MVQSIEWAMEVVGGDGQINDWMEEGGKEGVSGGVGGQC